MDWGITLPLYFSFCCRLRGRFLPLCYSFVAAVGVPAYPAVFLVLFLMPISSTFNQLRQRGGAHLVRQRICRSENMVDSRVYSVNVDGADLYDSGCCLLEVNRYW